MKKLFIIALIIGMMTLCGCTTKSDARIDETNRFIQETQEYIEFLEAMTNS